MTKTKSNHLEWYQNELKKDRVEIEREKENFIKEIKKLRKEDIVTKQPVKLSLWQRIKKVFMD